MSSARALTLPTKLCEGAFDALMSGDSAKHDAMVATALKELALQVDVIVLAQASMARVVGRLQSNDGSPILSSPELAMVRAQRLFMSEPDTVVRL